MFGEYNRLRSLKKKKNVRKTALLPAEAIHISSPTIFSVGEGGAENYDHMFKPFDNTFIYCPKVVALSYFISRLHI
jgi:hypothetical protein